MTAAIMTASASVVVAMLVFVLNQMGQVRQERRHARLTRVNDQLHHLYGPLNVLLEVNEQLWRLLRDTYLPTRCRRRPEAGTPEWREWRDQVLMPANRQMRDVIVEHADLLVEADMPTALRDFCAHVSALEIVMLEEARNVHREALVPHPGAALAEYVHRTFAQLKRAQRSLLKP